jgi:ATP-dependent protease HslVU (ClpYQ) ATPase subunit
MAKKSRRDQQYTDEEALQRRDHAKRLMDDEILQEAFELAEEQTVADWKQSEEVGQREAAHAQIVALEKVQRELRTIISNGEHAYARLKQKGLAE